MRGDIKEAITVFRINTILFSQSVICFDSLGGAFRKAGLHEKAIQAYESAQKLDLQNESILQQLKESRATGG